MLQSKELARQKSKRTIHVQIIKHLREMHRLLGIWLAVFLIFLSISGLLINHGNSLSLDSRHVTSSWMLDHYGVKNPASIRKYALPISGQEQRVYVVDNQVWSGNKLVLDSEQQLVLVSAWQDFILLLTSQKIYLYTSQFELVDILDQLSGLPSGITDISYKGDVVYLHTANGVWLSDDEFYSWQAVPNYRESKQTTFAVEEISAAEKHHLALQYRQQFLTWEQVLLDMHSGRFFGQFGVLLMDLVAILIIVLSITGIYIWVRQSRARKR